MYQRFTQLVPDFNNTDIIEMIIEFIKSLPTLLFWLLQPVIDNIHWLIICILLTILFVFTKKHIRLYKIKKTLVRELINLGVNIKKASKQSSFCCIHQNDEMLLTTSNKRKVIIKIIHNIKKNTYVHVVSHNIYMSSSSPISPSSDIIHKNIDASNIDEMAQIASENHYKMRNIQYSFTSDEDYEKILVFIQEPARLTYNKPNGSIVEIRDGEKVFDTIFTSKHALIRYIERISK